MKIIKYMYFKGLVDEKIFYNIITTFLFYFAKS